MKKTFKKAIAVLLTVLMVVFSVPMSALAAPIVTPQDFGSYAPDLSLQFGTFHDGTDYWQTYKTGASAALDPSMSGLYDVPVDFDYKIDPTTGAATGKLYIDKDKANKANEVLFPDGDAEPVTENIVYGVGDYFTATVIVKNVTELKMLMANIQYSDNIEPAGTYSYRSGRSNLYSIGSLSDCTAAKGTMLIGGTSPYDKMSIFDLYGGKDAGIDDSADAPTLDSTERRINLSFANGSQVNANLHDDYFADPTNGDLNGYTYDDGVIVDTFIFKIVGEGDITFGLYDIDNTKMSNYMGAAYIAKTEEGAMVENYSTYAINTYGGQENPGSAKMTFMGKNVNVGGEDVHEHDYAETSRTDATCTEDGKIVYTCQSTVGTCDAPTKEEVITATGHTPVDVPAKAPTCTEPGLTAGTKCSVCDAVITAGTEIPALKHDYNSEVTKAATCTEDGVRTYTCTRCDDSYTEAIKATGHTEAEIPAVAATCTTPGSTAGVKCSVCDTVITAPETIPALGHSWTSEVTKAATCTEEGVTTFTCTRCNDSYTEAIPATGHTEAEIPAVAPTCTEAGSTAGVKCSVCDAVITAPETIAALGHDFSVVVSSTAADCQTVGTTTYKCSRCNETKTVEGGYGPHTEVEIPAVAPTCTEAGSTAGTKCSVCGEILVAPTEVPATGHAWDEGVVTQAPTCTEDGVKTFTCATCGTTKTEAIAATGHTEVEIPAVAATCTTAGSTAGTKCSVCGEILVAPETIDALGHVEKTTVTRVEPTFDAEGSVTTVVTCERCGEELSTSVEKLPMLKSYTVTVDATDMGYVTINGEDASEGAAVKVAPESKVTLTAQAVEGATFVGWTANGVTLVSTDAQFTTTVLANVTYTPVFEVATEAEFTVTFVDAFGNVVSVQNSVDGITVPAAPARPGYAAATENGWSLTNDEIAALTSNATVTAQYVKAEDVLYTVTAEGCEITANGETVNDTVSVPFDTKVTVTNTSATAWVVKDAVSGKEVTVAYGDSYTFFVTADITLSIATDAVVAAPTVANVGVSTTGATGAVKAVFKATRTMADGCQFIDAGFVYGKGDLGAITLDDVDGKAVKAAYTKTASEQFSLTYGLSAQQGTMTAVAFVAYVDVDGNNQVVYADPMTYTY